MNKIFKGNFLLNHLTLFLAIIFRHGFLLMKLQAKILIPQNNNFKHDFFMGLNNIEHKLKIIL